MHGGPGATLSFTRGARSVSSQRPMRSGPITTRAFGTPPLNRLEAHARSLLCFFLVYSLGHMVIRWLGFCRIDLVEPIVAPTPYDSIWKFK